MSGYNHREIEQKWQKVWADSKLYETKENDGRSFGSAQDRPKYYVLDMFPYPSGTGLHVGHPKGYIATDVVARQMMMRGFNVLHPMGWDAFGLPAENYALETGVHPKVSTARNIETYKKQLELLGFTYDWTREINTTDPEYYKWTQWAFAEMFKKGLVYESNEPINWCPSCKTGLANEDVEDGKCERCGTPVEKKPLRQWVIRITDYAERLLDDLELLPEWEESIKGMQRNWIGRSEGAVVKFQISKTKDEISEIEVFTTRPDTIFGATYLVLSPEHEFIKSSLSLTGEGRGEGDKKAIVISNNKEVKEYINQVKNKSDLERTDLNKDKTGVELKGLKAVNPATGEEIPVFVADYVLPGYGTGAIMAVPAHDERDHEFAVKFKLPIKEIEPQDLDEILKWLEDKKIGERKIQYKLRDWVFSRQRYWGEPIPLIFCENCQLKVKSEKLKVNNEGERANPGWFVDENLPVKLPEVDKYEPSGTGESPLANIKDWVNTSCPHCGGPARRETNTMPQWAGSSWYYLAYTMQGISKSKFPISNYKEVIDYWNPVDLYVGGAEHATRHLIYARFWHKFLFDIKAVGAPEPFTKLRHVGLILAEDGRKMSKRWHNVINPDDVVAEFGADALRVYEMFMGPFDQPVAWNTSGLRGARKFLEKIYQISINNQQATINKGAGTSDRQQSEKKIKNLLHKTIRKVTEDIADFKFNTAISALMILVNEMSDVKVVAKKDCEILLQLLAPFAPHLSEELWAELGNKQSIFLSVWPICDEKLAMDDSATIVIQINGKLRDQMSVDMDTDEKTLENMAKEREKIKEWLAGKKIVKVVAVKNKLVNIVIN